MARLQGVRRILTLRCREASRLASESLDRDLPAADRLALRIHQWICRSCGRYGRQILQIREVAARIGKDVDPPIASARMPDERREQIRRAIGGE